MVEELTDLAVVLGGVPRAERPLIENSCALSEDDISLFPKGLLGLGLKLPLSPRSQ